MGYIFRAYLQIILGIHHCMVGKYITLLTPVDTNNFQSVHEWSTGRWKTNRYHIERSTNRVEN